MILLLGEAEAGSNISDSEIRNMDVVIYDTQNKSFIKADSNKLNGKNSKIIIDDYNGDQVLDIMIKSDDGKNKNIRIYTFSNNKIMEIWKDRNNKGLVFSGEFVDGFKVKIENKKLNFEQTINLINQKDDLISRGFYEKSGKLKNNDNKIKNTGFIMIDTVKLNDRCGIRTTQNILGIDENDILDEIEVVWKYNDGKWQMVEARGLKLGNLLY